MAENDGSIRVGVYISDEKAKKKLDQLESKMRRQTEQVNKQEAAVRRLQEQYNRLASGEAEPKSVKQMTADLKKAEAEAAKLDQEFQRLQNIASIDRQVSGKVNPETQAQLEEVKQKLEQTDLRADNLKKRLAEIKMNPESSDEAKKLADDLSLATDKLSRLKLESESTQKAISDLSSGFGGRFQQAIASIGIMTKKIKSGFTQAAEAVKPALDKIKEKIKGIGKERGFDQAGKSVQRFKNRLKSIVTGALFFNIISKGLTALTQQIGKYLTANKDFSSALSGLKSNLLTAFQPIYDAVLPALNALMQSLEKITAQAAAFIAQIFGTTAQKAQENADALYDQANATEEAGKAAKKAEKYLASFDTVEKLGSTQTDKKNETAPGFDTNYAQVQIPQWVSDFWKVFQDSWNQYGATTMQAFQDAISRIKEALLTVGQAFMSVWTGGQGLETLNLLQLSLQLLLNIIGSIAAAFTEAWNSGAGEAVLDALFYMLQSILDLIISIGQSFLNVWNNGTGEQILTTILNIIENIFELVGNLANRFREAWEANGTGEAIWQGVLDIIQIILDVIKNITKSTADWAKTLNFEPFLQSIKNLIEAFKPLIQKIGDTLSGIWKNVALPFFSWVVETAIPQIIDAITGFITFLTNNYQTVLSFAGGITAVFLAFKGAALVASAITALQKLIGVVRALFLIVQANPIIAVITAIIFAIGLLIVNWEKVKETVSNVIDSIVGFIQKAVDAVKGFFETLSGGGKVSYESSVTSRSVPPAYNSASLMDAYPHLARGAVIPPNHEFLAVLGDQRAGKNIETPLSAMKQAFLEALGESGEYSGGDVNVNIKFTGSTAQLARVLQPEIEVERQRRGPRLITGGAY